MKYNAAFPYEIFSSIISSPLIYKLNRSLEKHYRKHRQQRRKCKGNSGKYGCELRVDSQDEMFANHHQ